MAHEFLDVADSRRAEVVLLAGSISLRKGLRVVERSMIYGFAGSYRAIGV